MIALSSWYNFLGAHSTNENCKDWYHKMASILVYLFLPMAGLTVMWLRRELFTRILIRIEGFYLPINYPVRSRERTILDWAKTRLPQRWSSHLDTLSGGLVDFWKDGSLLCTLINSSIPGACPNPYRHWRKPPAHAQDVAYKYFGIIPMFTNSDLSSHLSPYLEAKLIKYLFLIRQSIYRLEKEKLIYSLISPKFVARGMGLYTAEQFKESEFFIYSKYENVSFFNIEIVILGPYSTYCKTTVLAYFVKESKIKNHQKDFEYLPEQISVHIELDNDKVRITYLPKNCGIYEISLSCNKESITGSPFYVNVIKYCDRPPNSEVTNTGVQTDDTMNINLKNVKLGNEVPNENSKVENSTQINNVSNLVNQDTRDNKCQMDNNNNNNKKSTNPIGNSEILEISKYLKDLSNSREKKVTITKALTKQNKTWPICPNYFSKENYSYFQMLADMSFRKTCKITRASSTFCQEKNPEFSSASPVCSDHIVPEGFRKLSVDEKRKVFALKKSSPVTFQKTGTDSSFSMNENKEETRKEFKLKENDLTFLATEDVPSNSKNPKSDISGTSIKIQKNDTKNRRLQKIVKEKKLFWESAFKQTKSLSENGSPDKAVGSSSVDSTSQLKHVDSLYLLRNRSLSKSLNDLRNSGKKKRMLQSYRSLDDNLQSCSKISLEDRTKLYLDNVQFVLGPPPPADEWIMLNKVFLLENRGMKRQASPEANTGICKGLSHDTSHSIEQHSSGSMPKKPFQKAIAYFRNLEFSQLVSNSNRIAPLNHKTSGHIGSETLENLVVKNTLETMDISAKNTRCRSVYINKENSKHLTEHKYYTYSGKKKRKSVMNVFDILY